MGGDELGVDAMAGDLVERAVAGMAVEAPEAGVADIGKARAELVAEHPEQPEDLVTVGGRVGHDLGGAKAGLVLEEAIEDIEAVSQGAGDDDGVEPGELVGGVVEVGDAPADAEVTGVRPCVYAAHRHDKAQPVSGGDFAAAPGLGQGEGGVVVDQPGVGAHQRLGPQVVLGHPGQPPPGEGCHVRVHDRFEPDVAARRLTPAQLPAI